MVLSLITGSPESDREGPVRPGRAGAGRIAPRAGSPGLRPGVASRSCSPESPQPPGLRELRPGEGSAKAARLGLRLPLPRAAAPAAPRWDNAASDRSLLASPSPPSPPSPNARARESLLGGGRAVKSSALLPPRSVTRTSRRLLFLSLGQVGVC